MATKQRYCAIALGTIVSAGIIPGIYADRANADSEKLIEVNGSTSSVLLEARGDAEQAREIENRWFSHSNLQPTGRSIKKGQQFTIAVPAGAPALEARVGAYGSIKGLNDGRDVGLSTQKLTSGQKNTLTADRDGLVFLTNKSEDQQVRVEVSGGEVQPVWVQGQTTPAEFDSQLKKYPQAPFVTFVGEHYMSDMQRRLIDKVHGRYDPAAAVGDWDEVYRLTNKTYGLDERAKGVAKKNSARIYIANPDTGTGYASATHERVTFPFNTGACEELLTGKHQWALWHETGHTYQTPQYRWSGLTEVTVNISALTVQQELTGENRLDWESNQNKIKAFLSQPTAQRHHEDANEWVQLAPFDQLRRAFGPGFYPALSQKYRVSTASGDLQPHSTQEQRDSFALMASEVSNRNLAPFFLEWGIPLSPATLEELNTIPFDPLSQKIWESTHSSQTIIEREVPYDLPVGTFSYTGGSVPFGQKYSPDIHVSDIVSLAGEPGGVAHTSFETSNPDSGQGKAYSVVISPAGTKELLYQYVDVHYGNSLKFNGIADRGVGGLALAQWSLTATSTGAKAHDYFEGEAYHTVELQPANGEPAISATIHGEDTAAPLVEAFDNVRYDEGDRLIVTTEEPSRLLRYVDGEKVAKGPKKQVFTVKDHKLVPTS